MSSYDNSGSHRRQRAATHWVPLAVTVAVATAGVAAWIWSQRSSDDDDDDHDGLDYGNPAGADPSSHQNRDTTSRDVKGPDNEPAAGTADPSAPSWGVRMAGALRRTPSPQQVFGTASKTVAAGMAAVGSALSAIREEDKTAYADHETWSEEADARKERNVAEAAAAAAAVEASEGPPTQTRRAVETRGKRKTVAVVVSADIEIGDADDGLEHAVRLLGEDERGRMAYEESRKLWWYL